MLSKTAFAEKLSWTRVGADHYYGKPENTVALGFVEGMNNKIYVSQRPAMAYATRSACASRFSPACSTRYEIRPKSRTREGEDLYIE